LTMTGKGGSGEWLANPPGQAAPGALAVAQWYALYTRSHCEQVVYDQLRAKGFSVFLPKLEVWSQRSGKRHLIPVPIFSGYLFLHHIMEKASYIEVCKSRGLVRILGERWDRLDIVPDREIEAIQKVLQVRLPVLPYPYLREGQRVRITQGPLTGTEGIFMQSKPNKGLIVLSVELLQRSVAVEIDCSVVTAA
jgi:transcription termination/antitermination protein NusG